MRSLSSVQRAPKMSGSSAAGRKLTAKQLSLELAKSVLKLCLRGEWISVDSIKEENPTLKAIYDKPQSTIPTYLGQGRSGDGLALHRFAAGQSYTPSFQNAALAVQALTLLGWSGEQIAKEAECETFEELEAAVMTLKDHDSFLPTAVPVAPAAPPVRLVAPTAPTAPTAGQSQKEQRKAAKEEERAAEREVVRAIQEEHQQRLFGGVETSEEESEQLMERIGNAE